METVIVFTVLLATLGPVSGQSRLDCRAESLNTCIRLADPLIEDPRYVFPSNTEDIDHVCNVLFPRTWSEFVSCIRQYTTECLTQDQRDDFNRAVGDSINSVHKMCTNEDYRNDYLLHAECIKDRSTRESFCGRHYTRLVEQVKGTREATQRDMCCTYSSFKACVLYETESCTCPTLQDCAQGMSAQGFARAMLDKALGFLLKQCQDYEASERDCPLYRAPRVEKQPRFNDEEAITERFSGGSYFPSGAPGREERREEDYPQDEGMGREEDPIDDWNHLRREEEEVRPVTREREIETDLITEGNFLIPVMEPQETSRTRDPWLPSLDGELQNFNDLFSNSIEPEGLASGSTSYHTHHHTYIYSVIIIFIHVIFTVRN